MTARRRNHYDVTNTVRISHPQEVCVAVCQLLREIYPGIALDPVRDGFKTFARLYAGTLPGYLGCDTLYHDAQHSLDCTLAMARLLHGHEHSVEAGKRLGERRAVLGILIALFHDAGYIRHEDDTGVSNGAEFTPTHVRRSGEFLAGYLPGVGYGSSTALARQIVHFTGYEVALDQIRVAHPKDRMLGFLLGPADVMAQTADRCYLEKYASARDLLEKTVSFNHKLWEERLDGYFGGAHRYFDAYFGGRNLYAQVIEGHLRRIEQLTRTRRLGELKLRPVAITARRLRGILGITAGGKKGRRAAVERGGVARRAAVASR